MSFMYLFKWLLIFFFLAPQLGQSEEFSFQEYVNQIDKHYKVMAIKAQAESMDEKADEAGSWGDPMLQVAAANFPKDSLSRNKTPMTGIKYSLMQKIALSNKFGNMKDSFKLAAQAKNMDSSNQKRQLYVLLWNLAIMKKKALADLKILEENKAWIEKMLVISKKLYTNGKIAQQALLDIQIRKSNLQTMIFNKISELKEIDFKLSYFMNNETKNSISVASAPWSLLEKEDQNLDQDYKEKSLKLNLEAKDLKLTAAKKNFLPDITVGLSYTKRANIDQKGDFVGASLTFPLPFSSKKYGQHGEAVKEKQSADHLYRDYLQKKKSRLSELELVISKTKNELETLENETKNYALSSREITSKSYRFGKSTYFELLKSELQLQEILLKENQLIANLERARLEKKFVAGAKLHE